MAHFATLKKGSNYLLKDYHFTPGNEVKIDKDTFSYLQNHEQFEVREDKPVRKAPKVTEEVGE